MPVENIRLTSKSSTSEPKVDDVIPFTTYIWKIASRCNLNCSYCYVYNSADSTWRKQQFFMSEKVCHQAALRIREHCMKHDTRKFAIIFHGGEPLLGGIEHLDMLTSKIDEVFSGTNIEPVLVVQSNGLLFTPDIGDLMLKRKVSMGISLDGPPKINDIFRVDHQGRPVSAQLEECLKLLISPAYKKIFNGFLTVINISSDPLEVVKYLLSYDPPMVDFLLPHNNYDRPPLGKERDLESTPYGDWLIKVFDYWFTHKNNTDIRFFTSIMRILFGVSSSVEGFGLSPVSIIVIETNGDIEALDALKSTYDGSTRLGYNVFENDFDTVARNPAIRSRQGGIKDLCEKCKECPVVEVCGGGYLPHRYSSERGYNNPSVYSADLEKVIRHISD